MSIHKKLGRMVKEARLEKGLTQLELSILLGYESMQFVSLFERAISKIPLPVMRKLIKLLDLNRDEIFKLYQEEFNKKMQAEL